MKYLSITSITCIKKNDAGEMLLKVDTAPLLPGFSGFEIGIPVDYEQPISIDISSVTDLDILIDLYDTHFSNGISVEKYSIPNQDTNPSSTRTFKYTAAGTHPDTGDDILISATYQVTYQIIDTPVIGPIILLIRRVVNLFVELVKVIGVFVSDLVISIVVPVRRLLFGRNNRSR